jgi:hypothetical protein
MINFFIHVFNTQNITKHGNPCCNHVAHISNESNDQSDVGCIFDSVNNN